MIHRERVSIAHRVHESQDFPLKDTGGSAYYRLMATWVASVRTNWDAVLAFTLVYVAIAMTLGPGFYFLFWYLCGCAYVIQVALKR